MPQAVQTVNGILKYLAAHDLDTLLKDEIHDSLLSFVDIIQLNFKPEKIANFLRANAKKGGEMIDQGLYDLNITSYQEFINTYLVLLHYCQNRQFKEQTYEYLTKLINQTAPSIHTPRINKRLDV